MGRFETRRNKLRRALARAGASALLVTDFTNVTYLTGFTGDDSILLVRKDGDTLLSDGRYTTQISEECPGLDAVIRSPKTGMSDAVTRLVRSTGAGRVAIEADSLTVSLFEQLGRKLPKTELLSTSGLVAELRMRKDREEVACIRRAITCAEDAFAAVCGSLSPEKTERQVADELVFAMGRLGAQGPSFPPIVAAGARAALPHAPLTGQPIGDGGFVLMDWGARVDLYVSDLTRVVIPGKLSAKLRRVYSVVLEAQRKAIEAIRPGVAAKDVDAVARGIIADAGYGRRFGHGLGHGIGLEVHEAPRLAATSETVLQAGMVVTVEPGVYLPGWGGVRIEDDVLVTRTGCEVLSSAAKQLEEVCT
ncbi:MAG: Xaa-Pro peptidase family protein [Patescibacteria group bacterium]|nr:Xaa-Pro peptidase family protein [Patescibacteria group bacterium]